MIVEPYIPEEGKPTKIRFVLLEFDENGQCIDQFNASSRRTALGFLQRKNRRGDRKI